MNRTIQRVANMRRALLTAISALLISLLAACASTAALPPSTNSSATASSSEPARAAVVPIRAAAIDAPANTSAIAAIKNVIQQSNQQQQQALAAQDPTLMRDTATASYYRQAVQSLSDLVSAGVTKIQLVNLAWGSVTLQGTTTAQATTTETWRTTFADGSTNQQTDTNVYSLVLERGAWKVQDDQHPDSQEVAPQDAQSTSPAPIAPITPGDVSISRNWAGYAATGGSFTAVAGTWKVPTVSPGRTLAADATWVGIGGVSATDLIQAGTDATVQAGQVRYTAWIELLPQASQQVPLAVNAGDTISVAIAQQSSNTWNISIRDTTTGKSYEKVVKYTSSHSSAEWVEEAPAVSQQTLLPLDNFGTVTFTNATTMEDGQQHSIAQASGQAITMASRTGQAAALPSALGTDGASFSVTRTTAATPRSMPSYGNGNG